MGIKKPDQVASDLIDEKAVAVMAEIQRHSIVEWVRLGIESDRKQTALMLRDGADEWEATGDAERFVNDVVDPFIIEVLG